ncbi:Werner helicase interacting protein 1, partial [Kappamyces sp. JEL0680]
SVAASKINLHLDLECGNLMPKKPASKPTQTLLALKRKTASSECEPDEGQRVESAGNASGAAVALPPAIAADRLPRTVPEPSVFSIERPKKKKAIPAPLAERVRPTEFADLRGQLCLRPGSDLQVLVDGDNIPNLIFFGPPGVGKTTSARMIGKKASFYLEYSATIHNIQDIRSGGARALEHLQSTGKKGVVFIDEIHRFTKAQQDVFLQSVERGEFTLIGATTENPSFRVNSALLSRCRVVTFDKLDRGDLVMILQRALEMFAHDSAPSSVLPPLSQQVLEYIADFSDGDARVALNVLEMVAQTSLAKNEAPTLEGVRSAFLRSSLLYDRNGEEHYNIISALHKSMRGGDDNASLYWLGRMIYAGEDPLYVARRLVRFASEDIGVANNDALPLALSTYQACQVIGMPECDAILAHCVTYLARSPKSVEAYKAIKKVKTVLESEANHPVPLHLRNAPTSLMKDLGYGNGYKYNPEYVSTIQQEYLPPQLQTRNFFTFAATQ